MNNTIIISTASLSSESLAVYNRVVDGLADLGNQRINEWNQFVEDHPLVANVQGVKDEWLAEYDDYLVDEEIEILHKLLRIKESPIEGAFAVSIDAQASTITYFLD